jgi:type IV pilus assembly protein PilB
MKKRLGEILVESGLITNEELGAALDLQKKRGLPLGKMLNEMNLVTENQISEALGKQFGCPYINLSEYPVKPEIVTIIPLKLIQRLNMTAFDQVGNKLLVAAADPTNLEGLDTIRQISKRELEVYFATDEDIQFIVNRFHGAKQLAENTAGMMTTDVVLDGAQQPTEEFVVSEDVPVIKFINTLLRNAFRDRASDIHIEPGDKELRVRFRIDGTLYEVMRNVSLSYHAPIVSRIKVMADLDIAEKRLPQDGRVPIEVDGKSADLRVSIIPTNFGEKIVLRVLYKQLHFMNLDGLGFTESDRQIVEDILAYPYGLIYVCGPTGSGKTTSLYAFLSKLNSVNKNLMTLEDPIEYVLAGITQSTVHPKIGLTFANGLRSFLRQDPDIIMVGETRDEETALITVQAALTGHLVLSTIHTNDAVGVINRLINMNIEPFLISSALVGIIAQRLVRKICPKCKTRQELPAVFFKTYKLDPNVQYYYGKGCEFCKNTGFLGRIGIFELLKVQEEMRDLILARGTQSELKKMAIKHGMKTLTESGLEMAKRGVTTIDEVLRVTIFN